MQNGAKKLFNIRCMEFFFQCGRGDQKCWRDEQKSRLSDTKKDNKKIHIKGQIYFPDFFYCPKVTIKKIKIIVL